MVFLAQAKGSADRLAESLPCCRNVTGERFFPPEPSVARVEAAPRPAAVQCASASDAAKLHWTARTVARDETRRTV
jgi:hypothetical protein